MAPFTSKPQFHYSNVSTLDEPYRKGLPIAQILERVSQEQFIDPEDARRVNAFDAAEARRRELEEIKQATLAAAEEARGRKAVGHFGLDPNMLAYLDRADPERAMEYRKMAADQEERALDRETIDRRFELGQRLQRELSGNQLSQQAALAAQQMGLTREQMAQSANEAKAQRGLTVSEGEKQRTHAASIADKATSAQALRDKVAREAATQERIDDRFFQAGENTKNRETQETIAGIRVNGKKLSPEEAEIRKSLLLGLGEEFQNKNIDFDEYKRQVVDIGRGKYGASGQSVKMSVDQIPMRLRNDWTARTSATDASPRAFLLSLPQEVIDRHGAELRAFMQHRFPDFNAKSLTPGFADSGRMGRLNAVRGALGEGEYTPDMHIERSLRTLLKSQVPPLWLLMD